MVQAPLSRIIRYCDDLLHTSEVKDYEKARNGLQVENRGTVSRIAAAVDGSLATARLAVAAQADLLLVHHGIFWSAREPWTGRTHVRRKQPIYSAIIADARCHPSKRCVRGSNRSRAARLDHLCLSGSCDN